MLGQQVDRTLLLLAKDAGDFLVDRLRGGVRVFASAGHQIFTQEDLLLTVPGLWSDLVRHAPFAHHSTRDVGGLFQVVGGTGVEMSVHHQLGGASTHRLADHVQEVFT